MTATRAPDRRVDKSRAALRQALVQLMIEKGYEQSSISDIAQRANVGRSTFYAHYADKEDLMQECIAGLRVYLTSAARATSGSTAAHPALAFVLPMLLHVKESRQLFHALGTGGGAPVRRCIQEMLVDVVTEALGDRPQNLPAPAPLVADWVAGGFLSTCIWWMTSAQDLTPEQVSAAFCALVSPGLGAAPQV